MAPLDDEKNKRMSDDPPNGNPNRGYRLTFYPMPGEVQHEFCGNHEIRGATCPHCHKPLLRILSLSASDQALNLDAAKTPIVHLLYCWTCSIPFGEFAYKINADGSIELIRVPERYEYEFGAAGPYDGYTGVFPPRKVALTPVDENAETTAEEDDDPAHQIGGEPFIANPQTIQCPVCSKPMPLLASICDDASGNDPWHREESSSFAGNGGVQMIFHFCRDCAVVSAYHCCD